MPIKLYPVRINPQELHHRRYKTISVNEELFSVGIFLSR